MLLSAPLPLKRPARNMVFVSLFVCLLSGLLYVYFGLATAGGDRKNLEEAIDDDLVWQEVKGLNIPEDVVTKMTAELAGIKSKARKGNPCEQYVLYASESGFYACYGIGTVFLSAGEIWKIGKSCLGSEGRYPQGLPDKRLRFNNEFTGTAEQCLIVEKVKLYAYFLSAENQKREIPLLLPPGNKIYR